MGQGKKGKEGEKGPIGDTAKTDWKYYSDNEKYEVADVLMNEYKTILRGKKGIDGNEQWKELSDKQKEQALNSLKNLYKQDIRRGLGNAKLEDVNTNVLNDKVFANKLINSITLDNNKIKDTVSRKLNEQSLFRSVIIENLSTQGNFIDTVSDTVSKKYKDLGKKLGEPGYPLNKQRIDELKGQTLWCSEVEDDNYCTVPYTGVRFNSYGVNLFGNRRIGNKTYIGGTIGMSYDRSPNRGTSGNALIIEGIGQDKRGVIIKDKFEAQNGIFNNNMQVVDKLFINGKEGGYLQMGGKINTYKGQIIENIPVYVSNIPDIVPGVKTGLVVGNDTVDNTWVKFVQNIQQPNKQKAFAAKKLMADDIMKVGGSINFGNGTSTLYDSNDGIHIKTKDNLVFNTDKNIRTGGDLEINGWNITLGKGKTEYGNSGESRAIAKEDNKLIINYKPTPTPTPVSGQTSGPQGPFTPDFTGGVKVESDILFTNDLRLAGNLRGDGDLRFIRATPAPNTTMIPQDDIKIYKDSNGLKMKSDKNVYFDTTELNIGSELGRERELYSSSGNLKVLDTYFSKMPGSEWINMGSDINKRNRNLAVNSIKLFSNTKPIQVDGNIETNIFDFGKGDSKIYDSKGNLIINTDNYLYLSATNSDNIKLSPFIKLGNDNSAGTLIYETKGNGVLTIAGKGDIGSRYVKVWDQLDIGDWTIYVDNGNLKFKHKTGGDKKTIYQENWSKWFTNASDYTNVIERCEKLKGGNTVTNPISIDGKSTNTYDECKVALAGRNVYNSWKKGNIMNEL